MLKTSKIWNLQPPKGLGGKDLENWYNETRDFKHTMLGLIKKEKKEVANKNKKN
jgi:hypothetical protein